MKVELTQVFKTDKKKLPDGTFEPLKSKAGKPYTRMSIKTKEHGDKWISGFANKTNDFWAKGMSVNIEVTENGKYLNFKEENPQMAADNKTAKLEERVAKLELIVNKHHPEVVSDGYVDGQGNEQTHEIKDTDLPF